MWRRRQPKQLEHLQTAETGLQSKLAVRRFRRGQIAQLVEQRTENPRVGGSIPSLATTSSSSTSTHFHRFLSLCEIYVTHFTCGGAVAGLQLGCPLRVVRLMMAGQYSGKAAAFTSGIAGPRSGPAGALGSRKGAVACFQQLAGVVWQKHSVVRPFPATKRMAGRNWRLKYISDVKEPLAFAGPFFAHQST